MISSVRCSTIAGCRESSAGRRALDTPHNPVSRQKQNTGLSTRYRGKENGDVGGMIRCFDRVMLARIMHQKRAQVA